MVQQLGRGFNINDIQLGRRWDEVGQVFNTNALQLGRNWDFTGINWDQVGPVEPDTSQLAV